MSCQNPCAAKGPHQVTPEAMARGNALLAEAHELREIGVSLSRQIDCLEKIKNQTLNGSRDKQNEAEKLLTGRERYAY